MSARSNAMLQPDTRIFSARLYRMWGLPPASRDMPSDFEQFCARLHPDDAPRVRDELVRAIQSHEAIEI